MDLARSLLAGTKNISSPLLSDSDMVPKLKSKSNKLVAAFPTCFFLLRKKSSLCISSLDFLGFPRISTVVKNVTNIVKKRIVQMKGNYYFWRNFKVLTTSHQMRIAANVCRLVMPCQFRRWPTKEQLLVTLFTSSRKCHHDNTFFCHSVEYKKFAVSISSALQ